MLDRLRNFKLRNEEENGLQLDSIDIKSSKDEYFRNLFGKIYGEKMVDYTGLKNTLSSLWSNIGQFKICELGVNRYQFVFASQEDKTRILRGKN